MGRILWMIVALTFCGASYGQTLNATSGPWVMERSGTTAGLRGIHAVGGGVAWASGNDGTILRTEDGGYEWQNCSVPRGAEKLDFRGIWAWDDRTAIVMSSGPGDLSRLYRTNDGCAHWTLVLTNPTKDGFWDAMTFPADKVGYLLGDPVGGAFPLLVTMDGGLTWSRIDSPGLTTGGLSISAFAASNSALTDAGPMVNALLAGDERIWFGTGGPGGAFVYEGESSCRRTGAPMPNSACLKRWTFRRTALPMAERGSSAGVFSLAAAWMGDTVKAGIAVGGDYAQPNETAGTAAWSARGIRWEAAAKPPHGFRSAVTWDGDVTAWIAAGTNGSDISYDDGRSWLPLDGPAGGANWNALSLPWIVGPHGRIAKLDPGRLPGSQ